MKGLKIIQESVRIMSALLSRLQMVEDEKSKPWSSAVVTILIFLHFYTLKMMIYSNLDRSFLLSMHALLNCQDNQHGTNLNKLDCKKLPNNLQTIIINDFWVDFQPALYCHATGSCQIVEVQVGEDNKFTFVSESLFRLS